MCLAGSSNRGNTARWVKSCFVTWSFVFSRLLFILWHFLFFSQEEKEPRVSSTQLLSLSLYQSCRDERALKWTGFAQQHASQCLGLLKAALESISDGLCCPGRCEQPSLPTGSASRRFSLPKAESSVHSCVHQIPSIASSSTKEVQQESIWSGSAVCLNRTWQSCLKIDQK